ncbi:MAG: hypothetical protein CM15mP122_2840 [Bacteroidota bacterium]|nr:MAG: hypothetical protein CM15mP122_2840 [Bacteroidota bacterium]
MSALKTTKNTQNFTKRRGNYDVKTISKKGDIVLIAGKGHESYQEIDGKLYPFNDLNIAKKYFKTG